MLKNHVISEEFSSLIDLEWNEWMAFYDWALTEKLAVCFD